MKTLKIGITVVTLIAMTMLTGCVSDIVSPTRINPNPGSSASPAETPDVLVPLDAALESSIRTDVDQTKTNLESFFLFTPEAVEAPAEQIVNSNPGLYSVSVTINPDNTFSVVGKQLNGTYEYSIIGQRV